MPGTVDKTEEESTQFAKASRNPGDKASESKDAINEPNNDNNTKEESIHIHESPVAIVATLGYNGSVEANDEAMSEENEFSNSKPNIETQTNIHESPKAIVGHCPSTG